MSATRSTNSCFPLLQTPPCSLLHMKEVEDGYEFGQGRGVTDTAPASLPVAMPPDRDPLPFRLSRFVSFHVTGHRENAA
jgi:hypothetical protein